MVKYKTTLAKKLLLTGIIITACLMISSWLLFNKYLGLLQIEKQLTSAHETCELLINTLKMSDAATQADNKIIQETSRILGQKLYDINPSDMLYLNISRQEEDISTYNQLVLLWENKIFPQIKLNRFNNHNDYDLLEDLENINSTLWYFLESARIQNTNNQKILNIVFISSAIILLLLTGIFLFIYYQSPDNRNNKGSNELFEDPKIKCSFQNISHLEIPDSISSLDMTNQLLTRLFEDPKSTIPYISLLREIEEITRTISSAIYITSETNKKLELLVSTETSDDKWSIALLRNLPLEMRPPFSNEPQIFSHNAIYPDNKFIYLPLYNINQVFCLLVMLFDKHIQQSDSMTGMLSGYLKRLANIVYCGRLAHLKLRHAQYEERAAIARELHDSIAQTLSYLKIQTSRLQDIIMNNDQSTSVSSQQSISLIRDLRTNLNFTYRQLRELISTFRLTMGGRSFSQALEDSINEYANMSGIAFTVDNRLPVDLLTVTKETQLLHIIREALSNVVRHSQAKFVRVSILFNNNGTLNLEIEDDGIGIMNELDTEQHHGIIIMQERAHSIGGSIAIKKRDQGGTCISVTLQADNNTNQPANHP